jgi:hypothetical protein
MSLHTQMNEVWIEAHNGWCRIHSNLIGQFESWRQVAMVDCDEMDLDLGRSGSRPGQEDDCPVVSAERHLFLIHNSCLDDH